MTRRELRAVWPTVDGEIPSDIEQALRVASAEDGTPAQVARLAARLTPLLGSLPFAPSGPPPVAPVPAPAPVTGWFGTHLALTKFVAATVVAGTVSGGAALELGLFTARPPAKPSAVAAPALRSAAILRQAPPAASHVVPSASTAVPLEALSPASLSPESNSAPATRPASKARGASPAAEELSAEARLVGDARAAIASDPAEALRLADEHRRRYSTGALSHEREVLAIRALLQLGRREEARRRLASFERAYPASPHVARFEEALGGN